MKTHESLKKQTHVVLPFKSCSKGDPGEFHNIWATIPNTEQSSSVGLSPMKNGFVPANKVGTMRRDTN